jgi:hypothetical protein
MKPAMQYVLFIETKHQRSDDVTPGTMVTVHKTLREAEAALIEFAAIVLELHDANRPMPADGEQMMAMLTEYGERARIFEASGSFDHCTEIPPLLSKEHAA